MTAAPKGPKPPTGAGPSGRRLWTELQGAYEFEAHETALLVELVRCVDRLDELHAIKTEGLMVNGPGLTTRVRPAAVESRQLAVTAARGSAAPCR